MSTAEIERNACVRNQSSERKPKLLFASIESTASRGGVLEPAERNSAKMKTEKQLFRLRN